MKIKELIATLDKYNPEAEVEFSYIYSDDTITWTAFDIKSYSSFIDLNLKDMELLKTTPSPIEE
jgi:hypothetical protein